jgi:hypothetical protein
MKFLKKGTSVNYFTILFGVASLIFWGFFYNQYLVRLEQLQLFEWTFPYLAQHLSVQGGLAIWAGEFLVQFFRIPFAGAIIITILLLGLQRATALLMGARNNSDSLYILSFLPPAVYWILLTIQFFSVSGLVAFVSVLSIALFITGKQVNVKCRFLQFLMIPILWWLTGAAYLVFTFCIIAYQFLNIKKGKVTETLLFSFISLFLALSVPFIAWKIIITDALLQAYLSEAYYQVRIFFPAPLIVLIGLFPVFMILGKSGLARLRFPEFTKALVFLMVLIFMSFGIRKYGSVGQENEIRYDNLVYRKKWDKIIRIAERNKPTSRLSLCAVNLALAKTGRLTSEMFLFRQDASCLFPVYNKNGMTPFMASEPFYYMGFVNFAQMFSLETIESTIDARYPSRSFKRAAETYIINGQYDIAKKYLIPLSHTLFLRRWANDCLKSLWNENEINSHTEWRELRKMQPASDFFYNSDQMDRSMQVLFQTDSHNKVAFEYLMAFYLIKKNFDGFLLNIHLVNNMNYNEMPLVFQEAAVFINSVSPATPPQLQNFPVKNSVMAGFRSFEALINAPGTRAAETTFNNFGNTYWYYIQFR